MTKSLKIWIKLSLAIGIALTLTGFIFKIKANLPVYKQSALPSVIGEGVALCVLVLVIFLLRRHINAFLKYDDENSAALYLKHPYVTLFLISFVILFVEVMFIRYCTSQIRIFSFYKNIPLISCFLGLGLGCYLGGGRPRHIFAFLFWLIPLAVFLSQGVFLIDGYLGKWTAMGSSEHVLGDVVLPQIEWKQEITSQLAMGLFCAAMLVAITLLFSLLGRLLGDAFRPVPRLFGYSINIVGSLAGILLFMILSYFQTPPWIWFLVGLSPLLWWLSNRFLIFVSLCFILLNTLAVMPNHGHTVWSPYQKLVGHLIPAGKGGTGMSSHAYRIQISDVFYQIAADLRPEAVAQIGRNPFPHYDAAFSMIPNLDRVLVVGAGSGNDVAAALRAGASHVDAVDIDQAIVNMGKKFHPEKPYDDKRVRIIVDDARAAFRRLPSKTYDAVIFGLLDSHTQLGISSVRLDNYVFTLESFASASKLLKEGGYIIVIAATFREWFRNRFIDMLKLTCNNPVQVSSFGAWTTFACKINNLPQQTGIPGNTLEVLPTDDWPFLYLPGRGITKAYLMAIAMLALTSVLVLRRGGLDIGKISSFQGHFFFLGAAFLLMEVYAINRLALLFGTTWIVSSVTIAFVLTLIVFANVTVALLNLNSYKMAYVALILSLIISYSIEPGYALGKGNFRSIVYGLTLLLPIYFSGLIFAISFRSSTVAGSALGVNILGSSLGGWIEYASMIVGIRSLAILALILYSCSLITLLASQKQG